MTDGAPAILLLVEGSLLRLCFAMTLNKSQGQSFSCVGVDLRIPPFTHDQLYVALSRVTDIANLLLLLPPNDTVTVQKCCSSLR